MKNTKKIVMPFASAMISIVIVFTDIDSLVCVLKICGKILKSPKIDKQTDFLIFLKNRLSHLIQIV